MVSKTANEVDAKPVLIRTAVIPASYRQLVFALLMSVTTAALVSSVISAIHAPAVGFAGKWLVNFLTAWPLVFLSILFVAPPLQRLVNRWVKQSWTGIASAVCKITIKGRSICCFSML